MDDAAELAKVLRDYAVTLPGVHDASRQHGNRHDAYVDIRMVDGRVFKIEVS